MGTNYYWYESAAIRCGRDYDGTHIGKSSAGWHFSLHIYPEDMIELLVDWVEKFRQKGTYIANEYNEIITADEMIDIIVNRSGVVGKIRSPEWYRVNYAHEGLNGLAAHDVDGRHCIGNSKGTWDYFVGEFS